MSELQIRWITLSCFSTTHTRNNFQLGCKFFEKLLVSFCHLINVEYLSYIVYCII